MKRDELRALDQDLLACIPEVGPFPLYTYWGVQTTLGPQRYNLAAILPCAATELNRRGFVIQPGNRRFQILCSIVGTSGTGKTTAISRAKEFTNLWLKESLGPEYKDPFVQASGSVQGIVHEVATHFEPNTGTTPFILTLEEFSQILRNEDFAEAFNRLYDGQDYDRHLRHLQRAKAQGGGTEQSKVIQPRICGLFASTPRTLEEVVRTGHMEGGLFGRMIWFYEQLRRKDLKLRWDRHKEDLSKALSDWCGWSNWLMSFTLSRRAKEVHIPVQGLTYIEQMLREELAEDVLEGSRIAGSLMRTLEHIQVIATLYALSQQRTEVNDDDMTRAANLMRICRRSIERLDLTLAQPEHHRFVNQVEEFIALGGPVGVPRSLVYRRFRVVKKELDLAIETLLDREVVLAFQERTGGRPKVLYVHVSHCDEMSRPKLH